MKNPLAIRSIDRAGINYPKEERLLTVNFFNGAQIQIYGADTYGHQPTAFVQYGYAQTPDRPTEREAYAASLPVAEHYAKWLNGGKYPKPYTAKR